MTDRTCKLMVSADEAYAAGMLNAVVDDLDAAVEALVAGMRALRGSSVWLKRRPRWCETGFDTASRFAPMGD